MADEENLQSFSDAWASDELDALRAVREELSHSLRGELDAETRSELMSRLAANQADIDRLVGADEFGRPTPGGGESSRSYQVDRGEDRYGAVSHSPPVYGDRVAPAAAGSRQPAGDPPWRGSSATFGGSHGRTSGLMWAILGSSAILAAGLLLVAQALSDGSNEVAAGSETSLPADPAAVDIQGVLLASGLSDVRVERRGSTIYLVGSVVSEEERASAIGIAQMLAGTDPVDAVELTIQSQATTDNQATGTRAEAMQQELNRIVAGTPIIFKTGQTALTELHLRILNNVTMVLTGYPEATVTIVGYTDDVGDVLRNEELSLLRANGVKDYLISQGIPETTLKVDARGEVDSTGSEALGSLERRVEFEVAAIGATTALPTEGTLRVAIVAPSARNDLAFTQGMVDALNLIATRRGDVQVAITDNTFVVEDAAAAIRGYAEQEYDLVIAHGSQFGASIQEIAPEFPQVAFAWGTANDTFGLPNVYAYDSAADEGGYVLGAMGAILSNSSVIGVVGPIEVGDAARYVNGFQAGARAERSSTSLLVTYTGSFSDLGLAAETAQSHIDANADVLTGTAQMVVGAVSVAKENGVIWFGTQANQTSLAPDLVVASQVYHWEVILEQIINDIDRGAAGGASYTANLANGGIIIEYNPSYALPADVRQRADDITASIISGATNTGG